MKYVNTVLFVFLSLLGLLAQEDFGIEEFSCSQKARFWNEQHNKSALHPNLLLEKYDVKFYGLDLNINDTTDDLSGNVEILLQVTAPFLDTLLVEFHSKLIADSLFINDIEVSFSATSYTLYTALSSPAMQDSLLNFKLYYHTSDNYQSNAFASTRHPDFDNYPVTQTLSEPYFQYEWMPCKQVLTDKADSVHVFITVDTNLKVAGPGLLNIVPLGDGKQRYEWRTHHKVAYYLIFFAVSDYIEEVRYAKPSGLGGDSILILNYRFDHPYNEAAIQNAYNYSKTFLEYFSEHYGMYPFADEKYGHYSWKPPQFSAMEHITMTGMRHYSLGLTSHELGHSWFGNNVTCATWQDIWVNEGFATFSTAFVYGYVFSPSAYMGKMKAYMNSALKNAKCGSVFVPANEINNYGRIFNGPLSYHKGAALVHMLRYMTGNDSLFFLAFRNYQTQFKDSVATGEDFKNVLESTANINLFDFFDQWYYGEGYPIYKLLWEQRQDSLILEVSQTTSCPTSSLFTIPVEYRIRGEGIDTIVKLQQTCNDTSYLLNFSQSVTNVEIDPNNWILNEVDTVLQRANFNLKVLLEGAYDSLQNQMTTFLNPNLIPLQHPYSTFPWECPDSIQLNIVPENIVDWILLEARTSSVGADSALPQHVLFKKAYLLDKNGIILDLDGISKPKILLNTQDSIYLVLKHRNHLPIMSAHALNYLNGEFSYDFTLNPNTIYGGSLALSQLKEGVYAMTVSDANANDSITMEDYNLWKNEVGKNGYLQTDFDLNKQTDNQDKNTFWLLHLNQEAILPEYK